MTGSTCTTAIFRDQADTRPVLTFARGFIYSARVSSNSTISRQHVSFAIAGIIFGFLIGFVVAHQVYGGRFGTVAAANAPETMGGQRSAPVMAGQPDTAPGAMPGTATGSGAAGPGMEQMEQVKRELTALKKAIEEDPKNVAALTRLGNLYMDAGMFDKAVEFYRGALTIEPDNVDLRTDMGTCLRQLGRVREALDEFQASAARDPNHWKSWFNIGIVYLYDLHEFDKAEEAFAKVVALNPGSFDLDAVRAEIEKVRQETAGKAAGSSPS
jgi:tetratricopeptide repeat protein